MYKIKRKLSIPLTLRSARGDLWEESALSAKELCTCLPEEAQKPKEGTQLGAGFVSLGCHPQQGKSANKQQYLWSGAVIGTLLLPSD